MEKSYYRGKRIVRVIEVEIGRHRVQAIERLHTNKKATNGMSLWPGKRD
jgi:hypothetical protein